MTGLLVASSVLMLAGCGDQTEKAGGAGGESKEAGSPLLFGKLPMKYQDSKVIKVGSDVNYAPIEFKDKDGRTAIGLDPDLAEALGRQLGVTFQFQDSIFDNLIPSLQTGRFDVLISGMGDTRARQTGEDDTGKKIGPGVDFVDYFAAGTSILVQKGNPRNIKSLNDLCGQIVALQRGTTSQTLAEAQAKRCQENGAGKLTIQAFDKATDALIRLRQGAAAANLNEFPVAAYNARQSGGEYEIAGVPAEPRPYGIAVRKDDTQMRDAIKAALDAIIENGEYKKILEKWNVADGAVLRADVNSGS
ncbi:ABC transporter substrate-binding protein [Streptosporangium sp. NPDC051023]|uniref:ABC transporter substrate-binding protein n=1 Tax=Streptosporangium sp. NPDC051023 TaxID=3155410 RepID=UPI00344E07C0